MKKELVRIEKTGSMMTLVILWVLFFWCPLIPILYMIFGKRTKKIWEDDKRK